MERQQDYVLRTVEERDVRLIRLWFTDVLGQLKSVAISPAELENAFEEGMHFDGSAIDGFSRVQESDVLARPDPNTFELLPWADAEDVSGRMFCDIMSHDGTPFEGDPRQVLRRNLDRAHDRGFSFMTAPEMEFFYFADGDPNTPPDPLDTGSYFDLTTADVASDLRRRTLLVLEHMGIPVEYSFHEDAPSQHEIDLRYTDALTMADNVMTFRLVVRELALEQGPTPRSCPSRSTACRARACTPTSRCSRATRTPSTSPATVRPVEGGRGPSSPACCTTPPRSPRSPTSWSTPTSASSPATRRRSTSPGPATTARPWSGSRSPSRQAVIDPHRVPGARPGLQPLPRLSVLLAAGLKGIEEGYELPPEAVANVFEMTAAERAAEGIRPSPSRSPRPSTPWRSPSWSPRRSGSTSSSGSCATSAPSGRLQVAGHPVGARPLPADLVTDGTDPVLPRPAAPRARAGSRPRRLRLEGRQRRSRGRTTRARGRLVGRHRLGRRRHRRAFALCRVLRKRDVPLEPTLLLVSGAQLDDLELRDDLFDDFCLTPFHPRELEARLKHLFWRAGQGTRPELIEYGALVLNLETYQAAIAGQAARPHLHGVRAAQVPRLAPGQGLHPRDAAQPGLGLRVLRRRPHRRRPRPPPAGQAGRGARRPHPDRPLRRLPLRPVPLEPVTSGGAQRR